MELSSPKIKKAFIFSQKKIFLHFRKKLFQKMFLKKILIFQEKTFRAQKIKKTHSEKISYFSGNGTFLPQT